MSFIKIGLGSVVVLIATSGIVRATEEELTRRYSRMAVSASNSASNPETRPPAPFLTRRDLETDAAMNSLRYDIAAMYDKDPGSVIIRGGVVSIDGEVVSFDYPFFE